MTLFRWRRALDERLADLEGRLADMPTRTDFDAAKAALAQAISEAAARVAADIQKLRDQLAAGVGPTDQDLADLQAATLAAQAIDPAA